MHADGDTPKLAARRSSSTSLSPQARSDDRRRVGTTPAYVGSGHSTRSRARVSGISKRGEMAQLAARRGGEGPQPAAGSSGAHQMQHRSTSSTRAHGTGTDLGSHRPQQRQHQGADSWNLRGSGVRCGFARSACIILPRRRTWKMCCWLRRPNELDTPVNPDAGAQSGGRPRMPACGACRSPQRRLHPSTSGDETALPSSAACGLLSDCRTFSRLDPGLRPEGR
ncbi:hypothetical protein FA09DRAFT_200134 [Tilletiopsis washingtonensis]|jgi:hypothetical protein|uniref:Uncharacterized protein n=1 Tax=Tilletiopsis washingtonensis TaxID=58919 RepID=A0A316ZEL1_9BASI|nr:hypothetical protein FA09DRAFT_200134 [Tilletiopsis washingtonensis]PWN99961.1 hypothetical protein FA09DRAFT_200134 [Tilletiopsis washingtonensis]